MYVLLAFAASCIAIGCSTGNDQEKLQGEWGLEEMWGLFAFDLLPVSIDDHVSLTVQGNKFTFVNNRKSARRVNGVFVCDATKSPRVNAFVYDSHKVVAIYSVSGRDLKLCVGSDAAVPPRSFTHGPGKRPALMLFRRATSK
jgi:uncharacterized protein (TIGR03067 family)